MSNEPTDMAPMARAGAPWTFLTNHCFVLICIFKDPGITLREVSRQVGITERAVQRIVTDLESEGYLVHEREGRRKHYRIRAEMPLRHAVSSHRFVSDLLIIGKMPNEE